MMSNDIYNDATDTNQPHDENAELERLLAQYGGRDNGLYLSKDRIKEIASSDEDAEKRQLAGRLLHLQDCIARLSVINGLSLKNPSPENNVLNPLDHLDEFWQLHSKPVVFFDHGRLLRLEDIQDKPDTSATTES